MSFKMNSKIDWITATLKLPHDDRVTSVSDAFWVAKALIMDLKDHFPVTGELLSAKAQRFYKYSFEDTSGIRIDVAEDLSEQGVRLVVSGSHLNDLTDNDQNLLRGLFEIGWNITRVDIAYDFFFSGYTPEFLRDHWLGMRPSGSRSSWAFLSSSTGDTFTVGSRQSPVFGRAYDKGKQTGKHEDWLRMELELKYEAAHQFAFALSNDKWSAWGEVGVRFLLVGSGLWEQVSELLVGREFVYFMRPRVPTNTERWLIEQVLPAYRKFAKKDAPGALFVLEEFVKAHLGEDD